MTTVRVLPEGSLDKEFSYSVPEAMAGSVGVGSMVRVELAGRRVGGWVVSTGHEPQPGMALKPLAKLTGVGPSAEVVDLAGWAAWRWAGRRSTFLRTASPPAAVRSVPPALGAGLPGRLAPFPDALLDDALERRRGVLRLAPATDRFPLVLAAAARPGQALVLCPTLDQARQLAGRLRRAGHPVAGLTGDGTPTEAAGEWARAASGATVVGARAAAWAPLPGLARVVVLDEHDESYQSEQAPTWNGRDVAIERARRVGASCLLVSPCPSLEALEWGELVVPSRAVERAGWPALEVIDRRDEDPWSAGLYSERLVQALRGRERVLCVVNRVGRSRLLACVACGALGRCEVCGSSVTQGDREVLECRGCGAERPVVCLDCGSNRFKNLRAGVTRVREEVEALALDPVAEVTGSSAEGDPGTRVVVGTEAALHRLAGLGTVAFLDLDQELMAPRYRAAEQALALLALGARAVRGREGHGRVLVQTRQPDHPVIQAALHADPGRVAEVEAPLRAALALPPARATAVVSGEAAPAFSEALGARPGLELQGPADGAWRVRAPDHDVLCDALAATPRPSGRLRIEVDPLRI